MSTLVEPTAPANQVPTSAAACLVCGGTRTTFWAHAHDVEYRSCDDEFSFYRCESCGVLFIDPVPANRLSEIYPTNYYSYAAPGTSLAQSVKGWLDRRFFRSILAELPGKELSALDVGGGAGWELSTLRATDERIRETWVVDLDPNAAELAKKNGHQYYCGRIEDFETDVRFDLILLLNLIEHVQDPKAVLEKVRSLLKPNGIAVVKTPNHDAWDARLFRRHSWAGYHCPRHWVLFTKDSLSQLTQRAGLTVRLATYTQGAPFWAASLLTWLGKWGVFSVTRDRPAAYHPLFGIFAMTFAAFDFVRRPFAKTSQMFFLLQRPPDA
jgi:2-polyprenyl-3-methyl-5-hydroxy-6-metoxy-1,4-benzoquinol methylase